MAKTALQKIRGRIHPQCDFTSCSRLFCCACPQDSTTVSSSFLSSFSSSSSSSSRLLLFLDSSLSAANVASVSCSWLASVWGGCQSKHSAGSETQIIALVTKYSNITVPTRRSSLLLLCCSFFWLSPTLRLRLCSVWTSSVSRSFSLLLLWKSICSKVKHKQPTREESSNQKPSNFTFKVKSEHAMKLRSAVLFKTLNHHYKFKSERYHSR